MDVTVSGKSIQEALTSALSTLNTSEDKVHVEVLEAPKKGFLGLIGSKPATIKVSLIEPPSTVEQEESHPEELTEAVDIASVDPIDPIEKASDYLKNVIEKMGIAIEIKATKVDSRNYEIELIGDKMGILIGKRGQTLNSFQYLANMVANHHSKNNIRILLDAENYRERRKESLTGLAQRNAEKVKRTGRKVVLEPMPSYERKVIHTALQGNPLIQTTSEGVEPHRYVVISTKNEK
nr:RNA-binding cell elongation regulator Jag/EloR [Pullulanibacillus pueri]